MGKLFFVFDVESVGLHGEGFSVAGGTYRETGECLYEFCFSVPRELARGTKASRIWVDENVPKLPRTHATLKAMRTDFWEEWLHAKKLGAVAVADCAWPVEARFLAACVDDDHEAREWEGPYPLHDLASIQLAYGVDPLATNERLPNELPAHHPQRDVRQSARLLAEAISNKEAK